MFVRNNYKLPPDLTSLTSSTTTLCLPHSAPDILTSLFFKHVRPRIFALVVPSSKCSSCSSFLVNSLSFFTSLHKPHTSMRPTLITHYVKLQVTFSLHHRSLSLYSAFFSIALSPSNKLYTSFIMPFGYCLPPSARI